jgi:2-iminobutanoate/2-iminopropanoate deaminase
MMMDGHSITRFIDVPALGDPRRFGYAHAVRYGGLVFVAGQMGIDTDYQVVAADFDTQARKTLENVVAALEAGGATSADLVSMTIYLTDMRDGARFFEIRREVLGDTLAASTTVAVSQLPSPDMRIEVQCVAAIPMGRT